MNSRSSLRWEDHTLPAKEYGTQIMASFGEPGTLWCRLMDRFPAFLGGLEGRNLKGEPGSRSSAIRSDWSGYCGQGLGVVKEGREGLGFLPLNKLVERRLG